MNDITLNGPYDLSRRALNPLEQAYLNWQVEDAMDEVNDIYPALAALMAAQGPVDLTPAELHLQDAIKDFRARG